MDQDSFPISFKIHTSQQKINIFTHDSKLTTFFIKSELYSRIIQETSNSFKDSTIIIHDLFKPIGFILHTRHNYKGYFKFHPRLFSIEILIFIKGLHQKFKHHLFQGKLQRELQANQNLSYF